MYLKTNDTIAIAATARHIDEESIQVAKQIFESWGLKVVLSQHLFAKKDAFAGNDEVRAYAFQELLDDSSVKAIVCARGGYGTVRIIDKLNFDTFKTNPKLIIGFSDVTVLHAHIQANIGVETIHACMPITMQGSYFDAKTNESLKKVIFGESISYTFGQNKLNKCKPVSGKLTGGNLSVLYSLMQSSSLPSFDNQILFIEDIGEYYYHIDRMMMAFKRSGMLKNLKALVVGGMNKMTENDAPFAFNKSCYEIISEAVSEYSYPVFFNFPAGHENLNLAIKLGAWCELSFDESSVFFLQK